MSRQSTTHPKPGYSRSDQVSSPAGKTLVSPETAISIFSGTTSKGVGRSDLQEQYERILASKNPNERVMRVTLKALRQLIITQGIPNCSSSPIQSLRHRIWKLLIGVYKVSADEYVSLVGKGPSSVFEKIKNDSFRTLHGDVSFGKVVDEAVIVRLLNAFAWKSKDYPTSRLINLQFSYVQGMNVLAAPFLYVMPEVDAFFTFSTFIHHTCPLYVQPALEGVHCGIKLLEKCLAIADPSLHGYLLQKELDPVMYAFPSVMTFSACTPPLAEVLRLWDFLLSYGVHMNILCIVAQMILIRGEILKSSSPMKVLRTFPKLDSKKVISMSMKVLEMIPDSLYDMVVRHVFGLFSVNWISMLPADIRLLRSIVESLAERLPCNSGSSLLQLASDPVFGKNLKALVELCPWRLWDVLSAVGTVLESITTNAPGMPSGGNQMQTEDSSSEVDPSSSLIGSASLHSQLFVLRLMANCLAYYWRLYRDTRNQQLAGSPASMGDVPSVINDDRQSATGTNVPISKSQLSDPPALDETLANYLLNILTQLFMTYSSSINLDTISHTEFLHSLGFVDDGEMILSSKKVCSFFTDPKASQYMPNSQMFVASSGPEIFLEIQKEAGKIVFYLSASNWNLVIARIRTKMYSLTNSSAPMREGAVLNDNENSLSPSVDLAELRILEFLNLNLSRMPIFLTEMSQCFKFLPKRVQFLSAIGVRRSLWNWIETHPSEFIDVHQSQKRVEGLPDTFFLTLLSHCDSTSRRRIIYWPAMMMLLCLCPDLMISVLLNVLGSPQQLSQVAQRPVVRVNAEVSKKAEMWFESVRKALRGSKLADVAIYCLVDLSKVFSVISKPGSGPMSDYYRSLIGPIDFDIRDKLFSKLDSRPSAYQGIIPMPDGTALDYGVPTEALVAILKLNQFHTLRPLISGFFSPSTPGVYRVILIRACYDLVSEDPVNGINSSLAAPIRNLFMSQENVVSTAASMLGVDADARKKQLFVNSNTKKEKAIKIQAISDLAAEHSDLVYGTLKVWSAAPTFIVMQDSSILKPDEVAAVFLSITSYVNNEDAFIRAKAAETLRNVFAPDFISIWDGSSTNWRSAVLKKIAKLLLSRSKLDSVKTDVMALEPILKDMLEVLRDLLKVRAEFVLSCNPDDGLRTVGSSSFDRADSIAEMEKALLVLLCSSSNEIVSSSISCIGYIVEEMEIACTTFESTGPDGIVKKREISFNQNLEVYRELCKLIRGVGLIASSRAMQRHIRSVISKMEKPSAGTLTAWGELYSRWKDMFKSILGPKSVNNPEAVAFGGMQDRGESQNYTAFLCAMGGVCHFAGAEISRQSEILSPSGVPINANAETMTLEVVKLDSEVYALFATAKKNVVDFIGDLQVLMVCENDVVREFVKNFLGNELHSGLFDILFSAGASKANQFLGPQEVGNHERNIFFVESFISVLKLILERQYSESDQIEFHATAGGVDFGSLILSLVVYLSSLEVQRIHTQPTIRIRTKVCQLVEIVINKKDVVALRQEIKFKNRMLDYILVWNAEISGRSTDHGRAGDDNDRRTASELKLIRDLDLASMRALVAILDGLPIQLTAETVESLKASLTNDEEFDPFEGSYNELKGHLFCDSLTFFLKVLDKCRVVEALETKILSANPMGEYNEQLLASKETLAHIFPLKDLTIRAISNLLAANIDIGLKFSLSMAYHEDSKTRTSFMLVLTNILESVGKFEFNGLGEEMHVMQLRYQRLIEIVVDSDDMYIALAMGGISDTEDVAGLLLSVFETKGQFLRLLTAAVQAEIDRTDYAPNLFRQDSMATRLLSVFSKKYGMEYLMNAITPVLDELIDIKSSLSFEIDPDKLAPGENLIVNRKNVTTLVNRLLDNLLCSVEVFPKELRLVCAKIAGIVGVRFPENKLTAVGSFMFLRFINPMILLPRAKEGVSPVQDRRLQRGLLLATKVIQNLANNLLFNNKERFMFELNELLQENHGRVIKFLKSISEVNATEISAVEAKISKPKSSNVSEFDLIRLHRVLAFNLDKVEYSLTGIQPNSSSTPAEMNRRTAKFSEVAALLTRLGPIPSKAKVEARRKVQSLKSKLIGIQIDPKLDEFITKVESVPGYELGLDILRDRSWFYESGFSKKGNRVVYLICRRLKPHFINVDILIYFMISLQSSFINSKYEMVIDASMFTHENEWEVPWLARLFELQSPTVRDNFETLYFYRPNSAFIKSMSRMNHGVDSYYAGKEVFVSDEKDMANYISPEEFRIPKTIIDSEKGVVSRTDVTIVTGLREHSSAKLKLALEYIHIAYHKRQQVGVSEAVVADVIKMSDIQDVVSENTNEFSIKFIEKVGGVYGTTSMRNTKISSLTISTPMASVIVQSLKQIRTAHKKIKKGGMWMEERPLKPQDVPGTLLNIALLNLGSRDGLLRVASYNLLGALDSSFNFNIRKFLHQTGGLFIPWNDVEFVRGISQKLADAESDLTIEFLMEFLNGFSRSTNDQKIFGLGYLEPWLLNVANFSTKAIEDEGLSLKLKSLLRTFLEATVKENELFHLMQTNVWAVLGKAKNLLPILLETFVQALLDYGMNTNTVAITNTLRTVAQVNSEVIVCNIIFRLLDISTSESMHALVMKSSWTEVSVLLRLLVVLSFDDVISWTSHLHEIVHIITLVIGNGQPSIRASVYSVVINMIHRLCAMVQQSAEKADTDSLAEMSAVLKALTDISYRAKFGVGEDGDNLMWLSGRNDHELVDEYSEAISPYDLRDVVRVLVRVVDSGCGKRDLALNWRNNWLKLILASTFNFNYVQSRTFVALGVLSSEASTLDLLFRCLSSLMGYLSLYEESELTNLNVSIVVCIIDIVNGLPKTNAILMLLKSLFWVAVGLIQISEPLIFAAGVRLATTIITILDQHNQFADLGFNATLAESRGVFLKLAMDLDDMTGIWFSADFSFAFAANVVKGFKGDKSTRELTKSLLLLALEVSGRNPPKGSAATGYDYVADHCVGYIIPLLPVTPAIGLKELFVMGGVDGSQLEFEWAVPTKHVIKFAIGSGKATEIEETNKFREILDRLTPLTDRNRSVLMLTLMVGILEITEAESEAAFIYGFLSEATLQAPEIVFILYESLLPRMKEIVIGQNSPNLLVPVHSIFQTMMACMPLSPPSAPQLVPLNSMPAAAAASSGGYRGKLNSIGGAGSGGQPLTMSTDPSAGGLSDMLTNINNVMGGISIPGGMIQSAVGYGTVHHRGLAATAVSTRQAVGLASASSLSDIMDEPELMLRGESSEDARSLSVLQGHGGLSANGAGGDGGEYAGMGAGSYPLGENQQVLSHLQELGFVGAATANSFFHGAGGQAQQKLVAGMVVQLIRVVLAQLQGASKSAAE
ncbi:Ras GTPase activating protein ira2 [Entophlyctis luteolus]|nr:Ras GTPase activating protein ira2 [Entophlyctis luteolus]